MDNKGKNASLTNTLSKLGRNNRFAAKGMAQAEYFSLSFSKGLSRKLDSVMKNYLSVEDLKDKKRVKKLKKDMLFSRIFYEVNFVQYFLFDFEKKNHYGRCEFVGGHEKARYTDALHATSNTYQVFRNKYKAFQTFRPYYGRDVVQFTANSGKNEFIQFVSNHPKFIHKIDDEALGNGISVIDLNKSGETAEAVFDKLTADNKVHLAEELIIQASELAALHPESVNTVRFATYLKNEKVLHMFSFLRMGAGGSIIDNATVGGISAAIDMKTGIITTPGCREDMSRFLKHPDTGVQIIGMQIPRWNELLELVDKLARVVPEQKYVGWDLALTNDGWVMVEGNDSAMMTAIQMCEKKGLRRTFDYAFKK